MNNKIGTNSSEGKFIKMFDILSMFIPNLYISVLIIQVLARLLNQAARDGSYVDPAKVQEILGVNDEGATPNEVGGPTKTQEPSGGSRRTLWQYKIFLRL